MENLLHGGPMFARKMCIFIGLNFYKTNDDTDEYFRVQCGA